VETGLEHNKTIEATARHCYCILEGRCVSAVEHHESHENDRKAIASLSAILDSIRSKKIFGMVEVKKGILDLNPCLFSD